MPFTSGAGAGSTINVTAEMDRKVTYVTLTISNGAAVSDAVDMRDYASGMIYMPDTWTAADLGAQISTTSGGTYHTLKDSTNAYGTDVAVDGPVADAVYPMPAFWFGAHYLKLHSINTDGTGANVNQGGDRSVVVMLKS